MASWTTIFPKFGKNNLVNGGPLDLWPTISKFNTVLQVTFTSRGTAPEQPVKWAYSPKMAKRIKKYFRKIREF